MLPIWPRNNPKRAPHPQKLPWWLLSLPTPSPSCPALYCPHHAPGDRLTRRVTPQALSPGADARPCGVHQNARCHRHHQRQLREPPTPQNYCPHHFTSRSDRQVTSTLRSMPPSMQRSSPSTLALSQGDSATPTMCPDVQEGTKGSKPSHIVPRHITTVVPQDRCGTCAIQSGRRLIGCLSHPTSKAYSTGCYTARMIDYHLSSPSPLSATTLSWLSTPDDLCPATYRNPRNPSLSLQAFSLTLTKTYLLCCPPSNPYILLHRL